MGGDYAESRRQNEELKQQTIDIIKVRACGRVDTCEQHLGTGCDTAHTPSEIPGPEEHHRACGGVSHGLDARDEQRQPHRVRTRFLSCC